MSDYEEHELAEPFDTDDGSLDGIDPGVAFAMGVEWQTFREELDAGKAISRTVLITNIERFKRMCLRRGRQFDTESHDSQWAFFNVEAM